MFLSLIYISSPGPPLSPSLQWPGLTSPLKYSAGISSSTWPNFSLLFLSPLFTLNLRSRSWVFCFLPLRPQASPVGFTYPKSDHTSPLHVSLPRPSCHHLSLCPLAIPTFLLFRGLCAPQGLCTCGSLFLCTADSFALGPVLAQTLPLTELPPSPSLFPLLITPFCFCFVLRTLTPSEYSLLFICLLVYCPAPHPEA